MIQVTSRMKWFIRAALREDIGSGDVTTRALIPRKVEGRAVMIAKGKGILAGEPIVNEIFHTVDPKIKIHWRQQDGASVRSGQIVCELAGSVSSILKCERVALNFLTRLSGIATLTNRFVRKVRGTPAKIYDTRKTFPLWRELEKYAVRIGGGFNHRMGLWDQGLIKDNHWRLVRDSRKVAELICRLNHRRWVVEISSLNLKELEIVLSGNPEIILLDNFTAEELKRIVPWIHEHSEMKSHQTLIEASGGVDLKNVRRIANTGVDRISVGAITHSAPALDFSLEVEKLHQ